MVSVFKKSLVVSLLISCGSLLAVPSGSDDGLSLSDRVRSASLVDSFKISWEAIDGIINNSNTNLVPQDVKEKAKILALKKSESYLTGSPKNIPWEVINRVVSMQIPSSDAQGLYWQNLAKFKASLKVLYMKHEDPSKIYWQDLRGARYFRFSDDLKMQKSIVNKKVEEKIQSMSSSDVRSIPWEDVKIALEISAGNSALLRIARSKIEEEDIAWEFFCDIPEIFPGDKALEDLATAKVKRKIATELNEADSSKISWVTIVAAKSLDDPEIQALAETKSKQKIATELNEADSSKISWGTIVAAKSSLPEARWQALYVNKVLHELIGGGGLANITWGIINHGLEFPNVTRQLSLAIAPMKVAHELYNVVRPVDIVRLLFSENGMLDLAQYISSDIIKKIKLTWPADVAVQELVQIMSKKLSLQKPKK